MPLANDVITRLNEITMMVSNKDRLDEGEAALIKGVFEDILRNGGFYDVEEIESWFENEGSWKSRDVRVRIQNLAHYVQIRHEQESRLRVVDDGRDSCSDESCSCGH